MSKRKNILDAAAAIINRESIHGITIAKVATEANIGKSTVYEYFENKEQLIQQTVQYVGEVYMDTIKKTLLESHRDFESTMKTLIKLVMKGIRKGNSHYLFMMSECKKPTGNKINAHVKVKSIVMGFRLKLLDILEAILTLGQEEGIVKKPHDKMFLIVWQNLLVTLAFEFSGVDEFVKTQHIAIDDDEKNVQTIYRYLIKMLQMDMQES
ncbi:TetR/AcrR family transcriptional regulator [Vallitalea pronyensis]|uniref:TetR/AcrR family transcriptional regulator n=1 Tax=Vallitalea pronyensis TaxID=1348613 RepID=A0A8J8MGH1_9FIRM|nr:TetR/AcrR family transcriptional regulator [Vallitalea pronyensis]QUI21150.1 TetR/AcrR family transcriptional regulator [Vallitalea pronyensis]